MLFQDFFRSSHSSQQGFFDFRSRKSKVYFGFCSFSFRQFLLKVFIVESWFWIHEDIKACTSSFVMDSDGLTTFLGRIKASHFHTFICQGMRFGRFIFKDDCKASTLLLQCFSDNIFHFWFVGQF